MKTNKPLRVNLSLLENKGREMVERENDYSNKANH